MWLARYLVSEGETNLVVSGWDLSNSDENDIRIVEVNMT